MIRYTGSASDVRNKERVNRTRMTRIERIDADLFSLIRDDPPHPRYPRSINPYTDVKTALVSIVWRAETTLYWTAAIEQILHGMNGSLGEGGHGGNEYQEYQ